MQSILTRIMGLLILTVACVVSTAQAQQVVYLDFDTGTDGNIVYTTSMRDQIEALMEGHYADFNIEVTQVVPTGDYSTIFFNSGGAGGLASQVDFRNTDANDTAVVNIDGLPIATEAEIISASAIIGSHEFGHLLGLRHGDSFGPIGLGRSSTGVPGAGDYSPSYPGPATADETRDHIMSSPASVASTVDDVTTPSWFSERSATKLSYNEQGTVQGEGALAFDDLNVPNTIVTGDNAGLDFEVGSFVAAGNVSTSGQVDLFTFTGSAGDLFNFEVISDLIDYRIGAGNVLNPMITVLDPALSPVNYYGTNATNDDEFETPDSIIIDLVLPADGTYTVSVAASASAPTDTGQYELFGFRFAIANEPPVAEDDEYDAVEDTLLSIAAPGVLANDSDADGDPITAVLDTTASNGSLTLNSDGSFTYDPAPNSCESDSFTYRANDGRDDSNIATVTINVACVNDAPVATDNTYTHNEDTQLTGNVITDDTGAGVDSDVDGDGLSINSKTDVAHGTLVLNSDGSFTYDPNLNYCGPDGFSYDITDDPPATPPPLVSNTATVSITVTCVNDPPEVTNVDPASQTSDYSDYIGTVTITVEDVDDISTTLAESNEPPASVTSLALTSTGCVVVPTESPAENGSTCTWTYDGQVLDPGDNTYGILFTPSDPDGPGTVTGTHTLTIQPEDATVTLDAGNPIAIEVAEEGGNSGPFPLFFSAIETNDPDDPNAGTAEFGDLNNMSGFMTLAPVGPGGPLTVACNLIAPLPIYPAEGYGQVALFQCDFDDIPVNTYEVLAEVDGLTDKTIYYTGFDEGVLVIYDPSLGFITGGGWFLWPGSDEPSLTACGPDGYAGDRTNIGFNFKYNKGKKKKPQGSLLLMRHTVDAACVDAGSYKVKSNALDGLSVGDGADADGDYGWATVLGKATFREPGLDSEGNHTFLLYTEDHGEQGCNQDPSDEFWIQVKDMYGVIVLEINGDDPAGPDTETDGDDEPLECGNIVVPHETGGKGKK